MTLARQLVLIIALLFLLVFGGTFLLSVDNTRLYLNEQLASHAQDTATALGLSLSAPMARGDLLTMESMVDAIYDRGYYREILVRSIDGKPLVERVSQIEVQGVPQWFVKALPLLTPRREAVIMAGWKQAGRVLVRSHPGYAYRRLWSSAVETLEWSAGSFVVALLLISMVVRFVLTPLRAVEEQALAIGERRFPRLEMNPRTRELRRVVQSMNGMASRVEQMLNEQTALAEQMRDQAYADPLTGTGNRRAFEQRLEHLLQGGDEQPAGALLLVRVEDLDEVNRREGFASGDEVLRGVAVLLQNRFEEGGGFVGRIGGSEFGILVPGADPETAGQLASRALRDLGAVRRGEREEIRVHVGVACFADRRRASELLAEGDMALRRAQQDGDSGWHLYDFPAPDGRVVVYGAERWRAVLRRAIDTGAVVLLSQPVATADLEFVRHHEVLARLRTEDGALIPAGVFMPMAERLGLAPELDRLIVEAVLAHAGAAPAGGPLAVNVSAQSMGDAHFLDWLCKSVRGPATSRRLVFEVPEHAIRRDLQRVREAANRLRSSGCGFGVDHFGAAAPSFGYLRGLPLDYIKVDGSYSVGVERNRDNQFFLRVLADIAHGLEMQIIAEFVETRSQLEALRALNVDAVQGYLSGRPGPLA